MEVKVKKLADSDLFQFKELIFLFEDVFEMKKFEIPSDVYLASLLKKDGFYVFVALVEGKVVGGLTAYTLEQYYSTAPLIYIFDLAVLTDLQRRGIGRKLIAGIKELCKEIGGEEVFVQADEVDLHALEFYRSTGGNAEKVVHFTYPLQKV